MWRTRLERIENKLIDIYYANNLSFEQFEEIVKKVLAEQGADQEHWIENFNAQLAPQAIVFEQALQISRMTPEKQKEYKERIEELKVVMIRNMISEQLASDLIDTRGFKVELERMLTESESQSQSRIAELEREVSRLAEANTAFERELASKNETIKGLLVDVSRKSQQNDSIKELEAAIHELDPVVERVEERPVIDRERMSRVLIGTIDNQELRFPLFKNRLTIGRAAQNDIQLQAPYISRRHAVVVTEGDTTRVVDWGSKNGVYVNSRRITEHFLKSGDILSVGDAEFRYEERAKR